MPAVQPGKTAPDFEVRKDGQKVAREPARGRTTLLAFYKVTCPTCMLAAPYINRLRDYERDGQFSVVAVAQDPLEKARKFEREHGLGVRSLSETAPFSTSSAYGVGSVPTLYLISPEGIVEMTVVGFTKAGLNGLSQAIGERLGVAPFEVAPADDGAPVMKPG